MKTMIDPKAMHWENLGDNSDLLDTIESALQNVAQGLSEMVARPIAISASNIEAVPLGTVPEWLGDAESEMVGVYLLIEGDVTGQVILIFSLDEALNLIDLLMDQPSGTTTELDDLGRSALAETGNLATAYFLNRLSALTGKSIRPSPPAVMVDMLGAIFNVISAPIAAVSDSLLILEAEFKESDRIVTAHFWVLPYPVEDF